MFKQKLGENHAYLLQFCMFEIPESEKYCEKKIFTSFVTALLSFSEVQLSGRVV